MRNGFYHCLNWVFYDAPLKCKSVLAEFDSISSFTSQASSFFQRSGWSPKMCEIYSKRLTTFSLETIQKALDQYQLNCLYFDDPDYPELLKQINDPPIVLFYKGNLDLLRHPAISVVGPRKATDYGLEVTKIFVNQLKTQFTIVSGLALGVDRVSHICSVDSSLSTIAVLGVPFDNFYPIENRSLFEDIVRKGLVLTEFPCGIASKNYHFPQRNRIISGLSEGVLLPEAGEKSGSLITARCAMEQGREVFAVPGSVFSDYSHGTHSLIQDGAKLVSDVTDIVEELTNVFSPGLFPNEMMVNRSEIDKENLEIKRQEYCVRLSSDEKIIFDCIQIAPLEVDEIVHKSGKDIHMVLQVLSLLEIDQIIQKTGTSYQLNTGF